MDESIRHLYQEGDVNFSEGRGEWYSQLNPQTLEWLSRDAAVFLHQSLSTPCLNVIESCEGIYLTDINGKRYMDFHGNSVHQVGYRNSYVTDRLKAQLDILPFSPRRYTNKVAIELAEKLVSLLPASLNRVLFAPGGTSAVGMALKLARRITGKQKVVSVQGSFHGASLDAIAVGGEEQFRKYMGQLYPETIFIPQADRYRNGPDQELQFAELLDEVLTRNEDAGAFIAETIRNTDVQIPSKPYWEKIREVCDRHQVLLILDEIPIAFGRMGTLFAFEQYGIVPDILCLGKGLGAGAFPIAAIITKEEYNIAGDISLGHYTHEKSPMGAAAALAMIDYTIDQHLIEKVQADESFIRKELTIFKDEFPMIGDIRGKGLLWAVELVKDPLTKERAVEEAEAVLYYCLKHGLSFKVSQGNVLQLCPPLIITREQITDALLIIRGALQSVQS
ncbi:MAG TPA: aspartate aminotransferase family protein [Chitinophagaceae bacterium]|nr:aspartate aminotransferase family protein [Chitinophagaceae bacterium]HPH32145.1 aspartate aminotransferase family protein [Chitinophagaceae bacterium]HPN58551.1 aspartate aminotransferase family protein [Chitinophagaceae bacterium]